MAETRVLIKSSNPWSTIKIADLWEYRELLFFLVWRDIRVRYKQTALGLLWILLQPIISTLIFTVLFNKILKVQSTHVPYPLFLLVALLPWNYFSSSLTRASSSFVSNASIITKVYFPRFIIPLASILSGLVDLFFASLVLAGMFVYYRIVPSMNIVYLPLLLFLVIGITLGFSLWFSSLNVRFRDVSLVMPFLLQVWMYVTPVVYGEEIIPQRYHWILNLNPMAAAVASFRWALLQTTPPALSTVVPALILTTLILITGSLVFRKNELRFAEIL